MNKQVIDLGCLLRGFPNVKFSMDTFNDRLQLQKFIYLLQTFDVYLGYEFNWYLRGPYCSSLAARGFSLREIYQKIPEQKTRFRSTVAQKKFERFRKFINGRENDTEFLEIAASLHWLKAHNTEDEKAVARVSAKKDNFTKKRCGKVLEELREWELI